ncbi:MAG: type I DNA topoisomerase [Acidimicrobiaceae bacterium]|nr:type I DNA topoisomerase [Acidimicrobiaceae bacterium]
MAKALVIVESPAKAKTISKYLGSGYVVESSVGHVRDLPASASEIPAAYKSEPWARLGIDVDNGFKPLYVVNRGKKPQIKKLKALLSQVDILYLATDEDREGEAIAWHLVELLNPRVPIKRMVFHEITESAISAAIGSPRQIDRRLVDAQEARRLLDRLYGYEVSPVLWKKVMPKLSAGRVQSVATRIIVERERERIAFVPAQFWDLTAVFRPREASSVTNGSSSAAEQHNKNTFKAKLVMIDGARLATSRDFSLDGTLTKQGLVVLDAETCRTLADDLDDVSFKVVSRKAKQYRRRPAPPFITSTFQQEAARKLRMSSTVSMRVAQSLYEQGYITYMRTDSTTLSAVALKAAKTAVIKNYSHSLLRSKPLVHANKAKNAQEAHEAIRPAGNEFLDPEEVARRVPSAQAKAYELIWKRTLASQMIDCTGETVQMRLGATSATGSNVEFMASGTVIFQLGFREVYIESPDVDIKTNDIGEGRLPMLQQDDPVDALELNADSHTTKPPARYSEASLIKQLEELGVGRPSTYAAIIKTIMDRGYVWKKAQALIPSFTAFSVVKLLEKHFPQMIDYDFTAQMELDLDRIARGDAETLPWLTRFYFGYEDNLGLKEKVSSRLVDIDARSVNTISLGVVPLNTAVLASTPINKPASADIESSSSDSDSADDNSDDSTVMIRIGRYGPYLQHGDSRASLPEDLAPDELTLERALKFLSEARHDNRFLGYDPDTGHKIMARTGRFGPYIQLVPPDDSADGTQSKSSKPKSSKKNVEKPKSVSLLKSMNLDSITLEDALKLLSLPRVVGVDPADNAEITAHIGRSPYIKKGSTTRSLTSEEQIFEITVEECLELFAQPARRGAANRVSPLRELGKDPETDKLVVLRDGRFGPYVTDGKVNASLRKGDKVEHLTLERAAELLADRRARIASKSPARRKTSAKRKTSSRKSSTKAKKAPRKTARRKNST